MGYTTTFTGEVTIDPPLNPTEVEYLRAFAESRRMKRVKGPYFVNGSGYFGQGRDEDVIEHNDPDPSQPGLWCQWVPSDDGDALVWDGGEKFYEAPRWMKYLLDTFICRKPDEATLAHMVEADPRLAEFTFDHAANGNIEAQGEESGDMWILQVTNGKVEVLRAKVVYTDPVEVTTTRHRYADGIENADWTTP